jgi:hypothetical protein
MPVVDMGPGYSGLRSVTPEKLLLDAGVLYRNGNVAALRASGTNQVANAIATAELWGATRDGGSCKLNKTTRRLAVDGSRSRIKGLQRIDDWDPALTFNFLEWTVENVESALGSFSTSEWPAFYEIVPDVSLDLTDYIQNIIWLGTLSGSSLPVVLVMENCYAADDFTFDVKDKDEAVYSITFYSAATPSDPYTIPWRLFLPREAAS